MITKSNSSTGEQETGEPHSPLPWRHKTEDGSLGSIVDANGDAVGQTFQRLNDPLNVERQTNAALIVTAVNSYADLLRERRCVIERLEKVIRLWNNDTVTAACADMIAELRAVSALGETK